MGFYVEKRFRCFGILQENIAEDIFKIKFQLACPLYRILIDTCLNLAHKHLEVAQSAYKFHSPVGSYISQLTARLALAIFTPKHPF